MFVYVCKYCKNCGPKKRNRDEGGRELEIKPGGKRFLDATRDERGIIEYFSSDYEWAGANGRVLMFITSVIKLSVSADRQGKGSRSEQDGNRRVAAVLLFVESTSCLETESAILPRGGEFGAGNISVLLASH